MKIRLFFICSFIFLITFIYTSGSLYSAGDTYRDPFFSVNFPFNMEGDLGIFIPLGIGTKDNLHYFHFDTHAFSSFIEADSPLRKSGYLHRTGKDPRRVQTTSGETFQSDHYRVDKMYVGGVPIQGREFMLLPEKPGMDLVPASNGIAGLNILGTGVWKIDFAVNKIHFANSLSGLEDSGDRILFAKGDADRFFRKNIELGEVELNAAVDLGTNAGIILPLAEMRRLADFGESEIRRGYIQTAAGVSPVNTYKLADSWVDAEGIISRCTVSGSERQTDVVLGLDYFRKFKYIIIDYPGRRMYVSAKRLN